MASSQKKEAPLLAKATGLWQNREPNTRPALRTGKPGSLTDTETLQRWASCVNGERAPTGGSKMGYQYQPLPPGKRLIFRRWVKHPVTGERIYARHGRAIPIIIDE